MNQVRDDFDRIARLTGCDAGWNHNNHYHELLLRHLPPHLESALDVGCGTGQFARLLAHRADRVLALDLSPEMLRVARACATGFPNITCQEGDVMTLDLPAARFDCIASIATLHHLPYESVLVRLREALKPGGTLVILDLYQNEGMRGLLRDGIAVPVHLAQRWLHRAEIAEQTPEQREAWRLHGDTDHYLPLSVMRPIAERVLPGAQIRPLLMWRYMLVWRSA